MNTQNSVARKTELGPRGLVCGHCGCRDLRVVYTRHMLDQRVMRRRECRHCGRRLTTWEKVGV